MQRVKIKSFLFLMLFFLATTTHVMAQGAAQGQVKQANVTLNMNKVTINQLFSAITKQTGYDFLVNMDLARKLPAINVTADKENVRKVLERVLTPLGCAFSIEGNNISVYSKSETQERLITGKVYDEQGTPLPGASIISIGGKEKRAAVTDLNGEFVIQVAPGTSAFTVDYLGFQKKNVRLTKTNSYYVSMISDTETIDEVVVNGMYERKKESFTGATTTFNKEELFQVGNQNLVKSLKNLDPAFNIVENLDMGSNPNATPEIQMRGTTAFNIQGDYEGNANQPLFILDGFETTLQNIIDLDMNRIQSVTLLKDAAAKAIYGSKAGNGVVVIETIRPKSGEMRIAYNGNLNIEAPDLTGYNLMNAQEKYDWELAHNKYTDGQTGVNPDAADALHKSVYDAIQSGVDTYWLSKPLRTGVGHKHSLSLEGGDSRIRYILGLSYNNVEGVMKGSNRNTFNVNSTLSYTYKNMVFRNRMDYTHNKAKNSPYGSFSQYIGLEPYFAPYNEDGSMKKLLGYENVLLDGSFGTPIYNPLYNAMLNTKDQNQYVTFADNFDMDWHINDNFRFVAKLSYSRQENKGDVFYPASHTRFVDYDANGLASRKGLYTKMNGENENFMLQAGLSFNKTIKQHSFFLNGTWNMQTQSSSSTTVMAEGFGNDSMDDISMSTSYYHNSHPMGSDNSTREVGFIGTFNYMFADRYLFDASIRETGSSVYGSDNHWGTFWSLGAGWNIHKEKFMQGVDAIKLLKLRYSLGYTGTQNFNPYQARAKYQYGSLTYDGRPGAVILGIPNTSLQWQKIYDNNLGLDLAIGSWLTARAEYYVQNTSNMLTDITLPSSAGFNTYKDNMGEIQNKGVEIALGFTPWRDSSKRGWITISATALHNKNEIKKIYDIFKKHNDDADASLNQGLSTGSPSPEEANAYVLRTTRPATKFYDGCSMTAIWGVRSLGIDPMTGNEVFLDKDGKPTYTWSSDDQVVIGDSNPKWRGTIGVNAGYQGFTFSLVASYKLGGDIYNTTLVDRVENVTGYGNLDKRVAETWTTPGQNAAYRQIKMLDSPTSMQGFITTRPTSRFVQRNNELYLSSINIGYDFYKMAWVKRIGLERLKLDFYMDEVARFSSIKIERGTSYPFARTFSFSLNATF